MRKSITKIIKWLTLACFGLVVAVYAVLAAFLWWGDQYDKPPTIKADPVYARSLEPHNVQLINDGLLSLQKRIELIDRAKKSIELEFFIYELDLAAKLVTQKLLQAAGRGVQVKLLVDFAAPVFKLAPRYASALNKKGIQVRYYNTSGALRIVSSQHRSHRKLLVIDGQTAVTGGRNIGNDYFNLSEHYNFLDSDLMVEGPIVKAIRTSFFFYWNSLLSTDPSEVEESDAEGDSRFLEPSNDLGAVFMRIANAVKSSRVLQKQHVCRDISFVTDYSGIPSYNRQVFKRLSEFLDEARMEVLGESPYFILRPDGIKLLTRLGDRGVKQVFLTNSLASTDAYYTISAMTFTLKSLLESKIDVRLYDGSPPADAVAISATNTQRWGVHAKRAVIDRRHIVIGTYNVDPRSANLNSELMLICRDNPELAEEMLADIVKRIASSKTLFGPDSEPLRVLLDGATTQQKLMYVVALPLAKLFDFLL